MSRLKHTIPIAIAGLLVVGAVSYGAAWWRGHVEANALGAQLSEAQTETQTLQDSTTAELAEARADAAEQAESLQREVGVLEASRRLHLALEALEHQNFGQTHRLLESAAELLLENAHERAELMELSADVSAFSVVATSDTQEQENLVRVFVHRLEQALSPVDVGPS